LSGNRYAELTSDYDRRNLDCGYSVVLAPSIAVAACGRGDDDGSSAHILLATGLSRDPFADGDIFASAAQSALKLLLIKLINGAA
jgi:hypothetical protein